MTDQTPAEARCDRCKQIRPLFLYQPEHSGMHLNPALIAGCRWCTRDKQPLLCVRCWDKERGEEDNDPLLAEEDETWALLLRGNMRAGARRRADVETVAAIAAASGMSGAADNATGGQP